MSIVIERGFPIPTHQRSKLHEMRLALSSMSYGDSFVYDQGRHDTSDVHRAAREVGVKVKTTKLDGGGFRVWRVS